MIVIIVALSYVPGVADHETAFAATQPSSGRTSDAKGDIVLLTTELGRTVSISLMRTAVQDQVVKLDAETSSVTRLLDFGSLFADYKASATHAGTDDSDELPVNLRAVAPAVRYNRRYGFLRFAVRR